MLRTAINLTIGAIAGAIATVNLIGTDGRAFLTEISIHLKGRRK